MTKNLDDAVWRTLRRKLLLASDAHVRVGVLGSKGGDAAVDGGFTVVELAAVHEFGSPANGIPERSFIRRTMADKADELGKVCARLAEKVVTDKAMTVGRALDTLGAYASAQVKKTITVGRLLEPNAPSTIAAKGSDRPLVDTGRLVQSITWQVMNNRGGDDGEP